jgi:AraC-like DNA-binding protein
LNPRGREAVAASALIRVEDEPPAKRLDSLRHALASTIAPFDVRVNTDEPLHASLHTGQVGAVTVTKVSCPRLDAHRAPELIRASDPELFKIDVPVRGRMLCAQSGREAVLRPRDFTLVDLCRPSRVRAIGDRNDIVAVRFPRAALSLRDDDLARMTAVRMPRHDGLCAPIAALALHLARHLDDTGATDGARLSAALMDLLIVALAARLDRGDAVPPATRRRALLASVQAFIDRRLADPHLSPSAIAGAHHISLRWLYKLFEEQGTTVCRWIRDSRLERCRRDLLDPALSDLPASAIGFRSGFTDAAHFSRVFSKAYGHPPGEYRRVRREDLGASSALARCPLAP